MIGSKFFSQAEKVANYLREQCNNLFSWEKIFFSNLQVKHPSKKNLVAILFFLCILLSLLLYWVFSFENKPKIAKNQPDFRFDIVKGKSDLNSPLGVATIKDRIYITDSGNGQVVVVNLDGSFLFAFDVRSKKDKGNSYPIGIASDGSDRVYVSDLYEPMIKVFSLDGKYMEDFPDSRYVLKKPLAIARDESRIYVTDIGDQTVKIFDINGKLVQKFGRSGKKDGEFSYPNGIAVAENGTIFVADSNNGRVQAFDSKGEFLRSFEDELALPKGIAIDKLGRLHVADALSHKVFVFNMNGRLLFSYGEASLGRNLEVPVGITANNKVRKLFITDRGKDCVSVWEY